MLILSLAKLTIHFDYQLGNALIMRTDCVKGLGVWLDNKLYFIIVLIIHFL
jgi:hypothetical protein